jgi:sulfate adenylyltransferase
MSDGVCVWLTGLSGAGKTTTAAELAKRLEGLGRIVTVLDGDVVRQHLSKGLGFSRGDRDTNIRRIAWVAGEIVRHGGVAVVAAISPYREARMEARELIGADRFVEVFVDTPLDVCEERDVKGLYARARRGEIAELTGVDDPYERPESPDVTLDTLEHTPAANAEEILSLLRRRGLLATGSRSGT